MLPKQLYQHSGKAFHRAFANVQIQGGFDEFQFIEQEGVADQCAVHSGVNRHLRQSGQYVLRGADGKLGRLDTEHRHAIGRVGAPFALRRLTAHGMAECAVENTSEVSPAVSISRIYG